MPGRIWYGSGGQAAGVDIQSDVPPMVQGRTQGHADLADDLRPHVESTVCILPFV